MPVTQSKKNTFDPVQVEQALYQMEAAFEGAMLSYFLLGDNADQIQRRADSDITSSIEVGVKRTDMTEFARGALNMLIPGVDFSKDVIEFELNEVPITIKIIDRDYGFLKNPDFVWYRLTHFSIPNPFKTYWKVRGILK